MRMIATTLALGLLAATPGLAKERVSDSAFIAAVRCQGALGASADESLKSFIKEQGRGRHEYVLERAQDAKQAGRREGQAAAASCGQFVAKAPPAGLAMAGAR